MNVNNNLNRQEDNDTIITFEGARDTDSNCCNKCIVFPIFSIKYENTILNHLELLKYCKEVVGIQMVLDLGRTLNQALVEEAVHTENYDLVLARLISVWKCN